MRLAPVTLSVALAITSAAAAQERTPVSPPSPPLPFKSGSFECAMHDEAGRTFQLEGLIGDWQRFPQGGQQVVLLMSAPEDTGLSGKFKGSFQPSESRAWFLGTIMERRHRVTLNEPFSPKGTISIFRYPAFGAEQKSVERFVGFCNFEVSAVSKELPE
ncbi:hypothetical protein [Erythrobacter donghaensis]|uniref:hypothetical protein n=1 Tax=Erythrobacter donghaensis TaxID=267135 RepID=UPI000A3D2159|nr:hypothetical protein [Erythrobacter donghaensis]